MSSRSTLRVLLVGLGIWIAGVLAIRVLGDIIFIAGLPYVLAFLGAAISGPPTVWIAARLSGYGPNEMVGPTLAICAIALPLDGIVMAFLPEVYVDPQKIIMLAPLFLWTFGWACLSAFAMAKFKIPEQ